MAANGPKKTSSPLPIIAILAVLGGAYYATSQLKSSRPEAPTGMTHAVSEKGKIDARLWQDPLKVACEHEKTFHGKGNNYAFEISPLPLITGERPIYIKQISDYESKVNQISKDESNAKESSTEHSISQVKDRISFINKPPDKTVRILLTMVRDGITAEDHERRLRNRYAMVTALYSSGFVPEDPMHIQYFRLPWIERNELEQVYNKEAEIPTINKTAEDPNYTSEPLIVPYEWFEQEEVYLSQTANTGEDDRPKHVLLVWLPESAFSHRPLTRLAQVIDALGHDPKSIDLIGPSRSGTLRTMLSEIIDLPGPDKILKEKLKDIVEMIDDIDLKPTTNTNTKKLAELKSRKQRLEKLKVLSGVTIFSPWSTTSPALLVEEWPSYDAILNQLHPDIIKVDKKLMTRRCVAELSNVNKERQLQILKEMNRTKDYSISFARALVIKTPPEMRNDITISKSGMYEVISDEFKKAGLTFVRMTGSDDLLAMELINELRRRGVDVLGKDVGGKEHHIALISEWDTFYGNAFPLTFATMMESIDPDKGEPNNWHEYIIDLHERNQIRDINFPRNLHTYSYIRGIDGRLPESQSSKEEKSNEKSEDDSKLTYTKGLELPAGRSQLDYVRRLTQNLSDKFKYFGNNKLKAIGVVGSDVYDKLVLLHALREQFSDMIIFTIDIDARMLHHEQLKWTRNVIVASNYGLELSDSYQSKIFQHRANSFLPLRDNYQTSLFLACRTALTPCPQSGQLYRNMSREDLTEIISHPQLFEIGRGRAVNLTVSGEEEEENPQAESNDPNDIHIHPPRIRWPGWKAILSQIGFIDFILLAIAITFFIFFVVKISLSLENIVPLKSKKSRYIFRVIVKVLWPLVILSIIISFVAIVTRDHYRAEGEPFSLNTGVSIWPGEILRLIAVIVGVSLIIRLVNKLKESEERLGDKFKLDPLESEKEGQQIKFLKRIKSRFSWKSLNKEYSLKLLNRYCNLERFNKYCSWVLFFDWTPEGEVGIKAQKVWRAYLKDSKLRNRIRRIAPKALAYMLLSLAIIDIFGLPNTPYRGEVSLKVNQCILFLSGIYMIILIFFVVDATYLCLALTGPLININTKWPDRSKENIKDDPDIKENDFAELLDVRFVTQLTEDIGKMIYWPFIVLGVMVAARFPYFDNWNFPISLIIIYAIPSIYLIICAVKLQRTAKEVRAKALNYLNGRLFEARFSKDENSKLASKLTHMVNEIESIREGAFRPFFENPVIHVILGSGGAGLLALLKYMPLS